MPQARHRAIGPCTGSAVTRTRRCEAFYAATATSWWAMVDGNLVSYDSGGMIHHFDEPVLSTKQQHESLHWAAHVRAVHLCTLENVHEAWACNLWHPHTQFLRRFMCLKNEVYSPQQEQACHGLMRQQATILV
jgi:hypothetical protein